MSAKVAMKLVTIAGVILGGGCSNGPAAIAIPQIGSAAAGDNAVAEYDQNGDGVLSRDELKRCPGLLANFSEVDEDRNSLISSAEIASRIEKWKATGTGMIMGYTCVVLREGRPFAGAKVEFIPESFLGPEIKPARGETDASGVAFLAVGQDDLPDRLKGLRAVQFGIYKVEVTHPSKKIPPQYNTQTTLGCEIYPAGAIAPYTFRVSPKSLSGAAKGA